MTQVATDRFGAFGGRYVPETLSPALDALEVALAEGRVRVEIAHAPGGGPDQDGQGRGLGLEPVAPLQGPISRGRKISSRLSGSGGVLPPLAGCCEPWPAKCR